MNKSLYLVKLKGRERLKEFGIDLGNFPIIEIVQPSFEFKWFNGQLSDISGLAFEENISYIKENLVPLNKVLWFRLKDPHYKIKILNVYFNRSYDNIYLRYYKNDKMWDVRCIDRENFINRNYNCLYGN